jgi:hypothetical protein
VTAHKYFLRIDKQNMLAQGKSWDEINRIMDIKYDSLEKITGYATSKNCRRRMILEYFNDPDLAKQHENCKGCDVCLNWKNTEIKKVSRSVPREIKDESDLSDTILETVSLYKQNYEPEKIAKIRSLGVSTIFGHLVSWYIAGGELNVEKFVSGEQEQQILAALPDPGTAHFLSAIKSKLPADISYEQIRMVIAKRQKTKI